MTKAAVRIAVTGAAGQITYSLLFRIASGEMLGPDQPVILHLAEITPALPALKGVVMELQDCAYPLLQDVIITDNPDVAFKDVEYALLVGARPRGKGMERKDLLTENGKIFGPQGRALDAHAKRNVKVLVVGNPANTNALIAMANAPSLSPTQFTAMTRLDHHRACGMLALQTGSEVAAIQRMAIWGNHSSTQYPDLSHALVDGKPALDLVEQSWFGETFIPEIQTRGAAVIEARGASSAASAGFAALSHMKTWVSGTVAGDWTSMAVASDGSYGIPEGLIYSFPVTTRDGAWEVVQGLDISDFSRERLELTRRELEEERDAIRHLL